MSSDSRRTTLRERSAALRGRATAFSERLKDARAKDFIRRAVLNGLDDVDHFFLGDSQRPSSPAWESTWLDNAESVLTLAEQSFERFEAQVQLFGGPEKVRFAG